MNKKLIFQLTTFFIAVQLIGLYTGHVLLSIGEKAVIVNSNPNDPVNVIGLFAGILLVTAFILVLIKFLPKYIYYILKAMESMALFIASLIVWSAFLQGNSIIELVLVLGLSLGLIGIRLVFSKNILWRNVASGISVAGIGALMGASLGVFPVLIFMVLLAAYDLIAVFKTKHMVTLAKSITKKNLAFTVGFPTKEHTFELGTGDLVIPLTFAVSILGTSTLPGIMIFAPSLIVLALSLIGLIGTMDFVAKRIGLILPALPPQTILMILGFGAMYFLGWIGI